ncbi:protein of unknown function [Candidatus Methylomirabilis oxygeniifera]|uniref:Uncharacterized protein n=1 Tax=Methylomirabilis oxygeniifera TaxID=671143 RepID=D5MK10_METO1|nr:protein of unknown function [Candidatus Methylomirabilis oxyfera]
MNGTCKECWMHATYYIQVVSLHM